MTLTAVLSLAIAFAVSAILGPILIPILHKLKFGQSERAEGPQSHLKKAGTPTMGGIMFLIGLLVSTLIFAKAFPKTLPVLLVTLAFGVVGFLDDYLKVVKKNTDGLKPKQKMVGQFLIAAVFAVYYFKMTEGKYPVLIPFMPEKYLNLGYIGIPILLLAIVGTVNAVNFTDGLDGLASSVTIPVALFFAAASWKLGGGIETVCLALVGGLMAFLLFNVYPAKVFMGDTGSLALGGFVAAAAYMLNMPVMILIVGLIYWLEIVSVIIQVTYFKKTGGKRIFRMTPIHHHFELGGWSETRVVNVFTTVTILLCLIGYLAIVY